MARDWIQNDLYEIDKLNPKINFFLTNMSTFQYRNDPEYERYFNSNMERRRAEIPKTTFAKRARDLPRN